MEPLIDTWSLILFLFLIKQWIFVNNKESDTMTNTTTPQVDKPQEKSEAKNTEDKVDQIQMGDSDQSFNSSNLVEFLENQLAVSSKARRLQKQLEDAELRYADIKTKVEIKENTAVQMKVQHECRLKCLNTRIEEIEQQLANAEEEKQKWKNRYFDLENEMDEISTRTRENDESCSKLLKKKTSVSRWNILVNNICFFSLSGLLLSVASKNLNH